MSRREIQKKYMVSASRRNDCVASDPDNLVRLLSGDTRATAALKNGIIHTLLISTKDPRNILTHSELKKTLGRCEQVCVNLTVTGFGGSALEPFVPEWSVLKGSLVELVDFLGDPRRLVWCFDPIMEWRGLSNIDIGLFKEIAEYFSTLRIERAFAMFYRPYKNSRLDVRDMPVHASAFAAAMVDVCRDLKIDLSVCHMPRLHRRKCVDASWYASLHPDHDCSLVGHYEKVKKPTATYCRDPIWDVGWYLPRCKHGCLYCYAAPAAG